MNDVPDQNAPDEPGRPLFAPPSEPAPAPAPAPPPAAQTAQPYPGNQPYPNAQQYPGNQPYHGAVQHPGAMSPGKPGSSAGRLVGILLLAVGLLVLVVLVVLALLGGGDDTAGASGAGPASDESVVPEVVRDDDGISVGPDGAAGTANDGAVEVEVYVDFMCPVCGSFEEVNGAALDDLRESGDVTLVLHPISILDRMSAGTGYSTRAASAAVYVAERSPEQFAAFTDAMFENRPEENTEGLSDQQIAAIASDAGIASDVVDGIAAGAAERAFGTWVTAATERASNDAGLVNPESGHFGTPTILIDGQLWGSSGEWQQPGVLGDAIGSASGGASVT